MRSNIITIILLICSLLMLFGSAVLFRTISEVPAMPAVETTEPEQDEKPEDDSVIIDSTEEQGGSSDAVIVDADTYPAATDFTFQDQDGNSLKLSDFYGKPTVINFFATWCPPCQAELPFFNKAYLNYSDRINFLIIDLVDDDGETVENGLSFMSACGYSMPLYFDTLGEGYGAYGSGYIPVTVLISANGGLIDSHIGGMGEEEVQAMIDKLLN